MKSTRNKQCSESVVATFLLEWSLPNQRCGVQILIIGGLRTLKDTRRLQRSIEVNKYNYVHKENRTHYPMMSKSGQTYELSTVVNYVASVVMTVMARVPC